MVRLLRASTELPNCAGPLAPAFDPLSERPAAAWLQVGALPQRPHLGAVSPEFFWQDERQASCVWGAFGGVGRADVCVGLGALQFGVWGCSLIGPFE